MDIPTHILPPSLPHKLGLCLGWKGHNEFVGGREGRGREDGGERVGRGRREGGERGWGGDVGERGRMGREGG